MYDDFLFKFIQKKEAMTLKLVKSCIILLLSFFNLKAQQIDSSFNNGSMVLPAISVLSSQNEKSRQVLIQDDNKIIIISHIANFTDSSYGTLRGSIIERYNADGTIDQVMALMEEFKCLMFQ